MSKVSDLISSVSLDPCVLGKASRTSLKASGVTIWEMPE